MPNFINKMMLTEVKTLVDASTSLIVLDPAKLNSAQTLKLRADLRGVGADPNHADAHHFLGLAAYQTGRLDQAVGDVDADARGAEIEQRTEKHQHRNEPGGGPPK